MAYFSNGSEGECFDNQCSKCKYGNESCPIAFVQLQFNYDSCNNETATKILDHLVDNDGQCSMFVEFIDDFELKEN